MANFIFAIILLVSVGLALWFDTREMYLLLAALIVINSGLSLVSYARRNKNCGS
jgi:hypothetical protein